MREIGLKFDLLAITGPVDTKDRRVIRTAKKKSRSDLDLDEWTLQGHAKDPSLLVEPSRPCGTMPRVDGREFPQERFRKEFEHACRPCVIEGVMDEWRCWRERSWDMDKLLQTYGSRRFKCGEDDDGFTVRVRLRRFAQYMATQQDDSPLYIFDSMFSAKHKASGLLTDYRVPDYFVDDLFTLCKPGKRPPFRWFLVGPKRSGTCCHVDPLGTAAWNALYSGRKRWVLLPPNTPKRLAKALGFKKKGEDDEAIDFFSKLLPRALEAAGGAAKLGLIDYVQRPGETMYVPSGWWHAVLNLDDTVAVTQNLVTPGNFEAAWRITRKDRRAMARDWLQTMERTHPHLAARAREMDAEDGYDLSRTAEEVAARRRREIRRTRRVQRKQAQREAYRRAERAAEEARARGAAAQELPAYPSSDPSSVDSSCSSSSSSSSSSNEEGGSKARKKKGKRSGSADRVAAGDARPRPAASAPAAGGGGGKRR